MENLNKQAQIAQELFNNATNTPGQAYENAIRDTVIIKKVIFRNGEKFYKRVRSYYFPESRVKYNFGLQFLCLLISLSLSFLLYSHWDHQISLIWFACCAALIVASGCVSGFAIKDLFLQKDFDRLLSSLAKDDDDREIFIKGLQNNLFMESSFTDEDFELLFKSPCTKEAAIIRDGVLQETKYFIEKYSISVLH